MPKPSQKRKDGVPQPGAKKVSGAPRNRRAGAGAEVESVLPAGEWRNRIVGSGVEDAEQLLANPKNWRVHPKAQQDALCGVLKEIGWVQNVIVNQRTGYVIDGHARVALAITKGEQVPVVYVDLDENEEAIVLASLDPLAAMACTDKDLLAGVLADLKVSDADLAAMLANLGEANGIEQVPAEGLTEDDAVPVLPVDPATVLGDVWMLGNHRLMCGDSTSVDAVERLMAGGKADMVFTDPPYGVSFQSHRAKGGTATRFDPLLNDDKKLDIAPVVFLFLADDSAAFIWTSHKVYPEWREQFSEWYKSTIIWYKRGGGIGDLHGDYITDFEMCLFCVKGRATFRGKRGVAVWDVAKDSVMDYAHPTQKPVALAERAVLDFSDKGGCVLDLFAGAGLTVIACEKTGRIARLMELDPKYCDVIVKRWQEFTGKQATLEGDGRTFTEISSERMVTA